MKTDKKIRVVFRHLKKDEAEQRIAEAFDLLFAEVAKRETNGKAFI